MIDEVARSACFGGCRFSISIPRIQVILRLFVSPSRPGARRSGIGGFHPTKSGTVERSAAKEERHVGKMKLGSWGEIKTHALWRRNWGAELHSWARANGHLPATFSWRRRPVAPAGIWARGNCVSLMASRKCRRRLRITMHLAPWMLCNRMSPSENLRGPLVRTRPNFT